MQINLIPEKLRRLEISGAVEIINGQGRLPLVKVHTPWSTAEVYLHGAHVAGFQKVGEPPLLFMSAKSHFAAGQAIRGGVPICWPWFGGREGEGSHGFARFHAWEVVKTTAAPDGIVTLHFALPKLAGREAWQSLRTEFIVTVAETLTMELLTTNETCGETFEVENCLHTYFQIGDINQVFLTGLSGVPFDDFACGAGGTRHVENEVELRIAKETNRVYPGQCSAVEIHDQKLRRKIRVDKYHSHSTIVWNPWTTQKLPDDFDPAEHSQMVCVESGNVKQDKIALAPGKTAALKVVLSSQTE